MFVGAGWDSRGKWDPGMAKDGDRGWWEVWVAMAGWSLPTLPSLGFPQTKLCWGIKTPIFGFPKPKVSWGQNPQVWDSLNETFLGDKTPNLRFPKLNVSLGQNPTSGIPQTKTFLGIKNPILGFPNPNPSPACPPCFGDKTPILGVPKQSLPLCDLGIKTPFLGFPSQTFFGDKIPNSGTPPTEPSLGIKPPKSPKPFNSEIPQTKPFPSMIWG